MSLLAQEHSLCLHNHVAGFALMLDDDVRPPQR
jgi:hypothetical protein